MGKSDLLLASSLLPLDKILAVPHTVINKHTKIALHLKILFLLIMLCGGMFKVILTGIISSMDIKTDLLFPSVVTIP